MSLHDEQPDAEAVALNREIDALQRKRDELTAERDKFRDLYEESPDMCASVDIATGIVVECNATLLRELGWERNEIVGSSLATIVHPDDQPKILAGILEIVDGKDVRDIELLTKRKDGSFLLISLNVTARRDDQGNIMYTRGVARDITEQKRIENALAVSEERLRTLTEAFNLVPWTVFRNEGSTLESEESPSDYRFGDYQPEYIGPQFEKLFGYPSARWFEPGFWLSLIHPEDLPKALADVAERGAAPVEKRAEYRIVAADGRIVPVLVLTTPTLSEGRRVLSGVIIDLTEIRAAEEAQQSFMRELDHRVKNTFASVHSVLDQTLSTSNDADVFLKTFHGRIDALANIHTTMATSGWTDVALSELIGSTLAPYGEAPRIVTQGENVRVPLDTGRILGMVLHELATNAVKHGSLSTPEGSVSVRWNRESRETGDALVLRWTESGGPPVIVSNRRGYGLRVIEDLIPYELNGKAHTKFETGGLCSEIEIPLTLAETGSAAEGETS